MTKRGKGFVSVSFLMMLVISAILMNTLLKYYTQISERWYRQSLFITAERMAFWQLEIYPKWIEYNKKDWRVTFRKEDNTFLIVRVCYRNTFCIQQKRINSDW